MRQMVSGLGKERHEDREKDDRRIQAVSVPFQTQETKGWSSVEEIGLSASWENQKTRQMPERLRFFDQVKGC